MKAESRGYECLERPPLLSFVLPDEDDYTKAVIHYITEEEAIGRMKAQAATVGYTYDSDDDALSNFMDVYYAERVIP